MGSSPLRSDGSHNDQAGEAGPVEQCSAEAKSLKLRAKGLSGCHPSGQQPRQPDGGPEGQNKELLSQQFVERNKAMGKRQPAKERTKVYEKRKDAYSMLKLRAQGLSSCHPSGQQPRQPDGGGQRAKERTTLTIICRKKTELKQL